MTAPTTRAALLLATLAACTPVKPPEGKLALGRVDVACQPRAGSLAPAFATRRNVGRRGSRRQRKAGRGPGWRAG